VQLGHAHSEQNCAGEHGTKCCRRLCELGHAAIDREDSAVAQACFELRSQRRRKHQRRDEPQQLGVSGVFERHVQQDKQDTDTNRRQPPAERKRREKQHH
jgi:hypothetical protein